MSLLETTVEKIVLQDQSWRDRAKERLDQLATPHWALGRLCDLGMDLAGMTRSLRPPISNRVVVVMAGDHGPFLYDGCRRRGSLNSPGAIRDRMGILLAIRWPQDYDGRFDEEIKTSVNVFRYVLASLVEEQDDLLNTLVPEDVFARGEEDFLKVMSDGELVFPPQHYSRQDMADLMHQ